MNPKELELPGELSDDLPPDELAEYKAYCEAVAASNLAYLIEHPPVIDPTDDIPF